MKTIKKMALLTLAVAAVMALVLPAAASAARMEGIGGTLLVKGTSFTGTTTFSIQTGWGPVYCNGLTIPSKVTLNDGSTVAAQGQGPGPSVGCNHGANKVPTELEMTNLNLSSPSSGTIGLRIKQAWKPEWAPCVLENSALPVTYSVGGSSINVSGKMKESGACPGYGYLTIAVNLTTPAAPKVVLK